MPKRQPDRMILSLAWGNPYTDPPPGLQTFEDKRRTRWTVTVLDRAAEAEIRAHMPENVPGDGWSHCTSFQATAPPRRWSAEAKARRRQTNLRRRLEARFPLLAEQLYEQALAARPAYYKGEGQ